MHIVVMGAGVIGTTTAWFLRQAGHEVTVLERQAGAGQETSFANGGQVSVSHAEPWANPSAPLKVLKWLFREDAPLLFRLRLDPQQWLWALQFLRECTPAKTRHNIIQIVNLGTYSRDMLQALRGETGIQYDHREQGILHFYTDPQEFEAALGPAKLMREFGCEREVISAQEAVALEPALASFESRIAGATYTRQDESGDAALFTRNLAAMAAEKGVDFRYGTTVVGLNRDGDKLDGVSVIEKGRHGVVKGDAYVLSLGSYSAPLARMAGVNLNIYPAKGYSVTVPVDDESQAHEVSLTDDEYKLVYSRLGDRLRIAGTAELSGYGQHLSKRRCEAIIERASELFPRGGRWQEAEYWAGLRPATPSNVPYVGRSRLSNLYLNTGHGTLGWTHSCGSACALRDIIAGRQPAVDFQFAGVDSGSRPGAGDEAMLHRSS